MLQESTQAVKPMTFVPYEPDIVVNVGDSQIRMYFTPAYHVQSPRGEWEFESRMEADLHMAYEIRKARYAHGFRQYCQDKPQPTDPDERRGWNAALRGAAYAEVSADLIRHGEIEVERRLERSLTGETEPSIEDDYEFIRRGGAGSPF